MTPFELLSLLVSVVAAVIALVSLHRTHRLAQRQLELEEVSARLSKKQLDQMDEEAKANSRAQIDVEFDDSGSAYYLKITNVGRAEAREIEFSYSGHGALFDGNELKEKTPIPSLRPGKSVALFAGLPDGKYTFNLRWKNPDESLQKDTIQLHV